MDNINAQVGLIKLAFDSLADEIIQARNGGEMLVHHINGDPNNKLVVGTIRRGKSLLPSTIPNIK